MTVRKPKVRAEAAPGRCVVFLSPLKATGMVSIRLIEKSNEVENVEAI